MQVMQLPANNEQNVANFWLDIGRIEKYQNTNI